MVEESKPRATVAGASRGRGRELALWILCHLGAHLGEERQALELFWREPPSFDPDDPFFTGLADELAKVRDDSVARRFARRLVEGYLSRAEAVDELIESVSRRWRLARMDEVDRNLLRLVAVELESSSTPRGVGVSEAVRLAARYGSERSVAFVNGLAEGLARVLRDASEGAGRSREADTDQEGGSG